MLYPLSTHPVGRGVTNCTLLSPPVLTPQPSAGLKYDLACQASGSQAEHNQFHSLLYWLCHHRPRLIVRLMIPWPITTQPQYLGQSQHTRQWLTNQRPGFLLHGKHRRSLSRPLLQQNIYILTKWLMIVMVI